MGLELPSRYQLVIRGLIPPARLTDEEIGDGKRERRGQGARRGLRFRSGDQLRPLRGVKRQGVPRSDPRLLSAPQAGEQALCLSSRIRLHGGWEAWRRPPGPGIARPCRLLIPRATLLFDVLLFRFWHPVRQGDNGTRLPAPAASSHQNSSWQAFLGLQR